MSPFSLSRLSLCALLLLGGAMALQAAVVEGTVINRKGARYAVRKIEIRGSTNLEYYVKGKRRLLALTRIERIHLGGTAQDQEVPITVTLRTGRVEEGTIVINGDSSSDDAISGGSHVSDRLTGSTELGPLFIPLGDVQEILFVHDQSIPIVPDMVGGSIVDERGRRFTVSNIRFRDDDAFRFRQGRKKRRVALRHLTRLHFEDSPGGEMRPVKITYRTGKLVQGEVDASAVRFAGEGDKVFRTRVDSAFTGSLTSGGIFGIGLDRVKLVLIEHEEEAAEADTTEKKASAESDATHTDDAKEEEEAAGRP